MKLNVITVNVSADFTNPPGVPPWDERKALLVQALQAAQPCLNCWILATGGCRLRQNGRLSDWATWPHALCRQRFADFLPLNLPLIFLGDFNFDPSSASYALLRQDGWQDPHAAAAEPNSPPFRTTRRT